MKLYTEEQVKQIAIQVMNYGFHDVSDFRNYDTPILPIEPPTDEEVESASVRCSQEFFTKEANFEIGAKWMRDKILNK